MRAGRLLEREEHLAVLDDALAAARDGDGRMVLIRGEAGIGKSALVDRFCNGVRGLRVLVGYCDLLATPRPLGPILDITDRLSRSSRSEGTDGDERQAVRTAFLDDLASPAGTTVAVVEDAHWADEATLDLLRYLGRRIERFPAVIVVTYRDDELGPGHPLVAVAGDLATSPAVRTIDLPPLSPGAVADLVTTGGADAAAGPSSPAVGTSGIDPVRLFRRTAGNPFFVSEILATGSLDVPTTVRDAVLARAARLPPAARPVLDAAAVFPTRAEIDLVLRLAGAEPAHLDDCVTGGMLRQDRPGTVAFRHELARQAIAEALPPARRTALHAALTRRLLRDDRRAAADPARVAHHAEEAGEDILTATCAIAAAERAVALGGHREATAQYERALRHAAHLPTEDRAALLEAYAEQAGLTDRADAALDAITDAVELRRRLGDPRAFGNALRAQAQACWRAGDSQRARVLARRSIEVLEGLDEPGPELAHAYAYACTQAMLARNHLDTLAWGRRAIPLAEQLGETAVLARTLNSVGSSRIVNGDRGGEDDLRRSIAVADEHGLAPAVTVGWSNLGSGSGEVRHYEVAEPALEHAIAVAAEHDLDASRHYATAWLARVRFERGDWSGAEALIATLPVGDPSGSPITRIVASTVVGRLRARRGDADPGPPLEEAARLAAETGDLQRLWPVAAARAEAAWLSERPEQVPGFVDPVLPAAFASGHAWAIGELLLWRWRAGAVLSGAAQPAHDPADGPLAPPFALELQDRAAEAAVAWRALGCPYEAADALAQLASPAVLREALADLDELGAAVPAARIRRRLRELGERRVPRGPQSATAEHPAGLTPRQAEVLALVDEGLSDAAIARRLHVAPKTVGHHVSAILGKLGVATRGEAAAAARRRGLLG
jgi:DNA-binding CsgD family transcriptional regulator/tetratricopeptide (TPR) repeat protein